MYAAQHIEQYASKITGNLEMFYDFVQFSVFAKNS